MLSPAANDGWKSPREAITEESVGGFGRVVPLVPAGVVSEVWRGGPRAARIARVLAASEVVDLTHGRARAVGELCGRARTSNPVDASVVLAATSRRATVVTSDPSDIRWLADTAGAKLPIITL